MKPVVDPLAPWSALEVEREALPLEAQAIFILVCVESILAMRPEPDPVAIEYLRVVWEAIEGDGSALPALADALESRVDVDDRDELAALLHAVGALRGSQEHAAWGASRLLDAAYERIPRPDDDVFLAPLADDTAHEVVQDELCWQRSVLEEVSVENLAARVTHLRARARTRRRANHEGDGR